MELQNQTIEETTQSPTNTSGQGRNAVVPKEIKGWNWGAFLLSWIWGLSHRVWVTIILILIFSIPVFMGYMCLDITTGFSSRLFISLIRLLVLSPIMNFIIGIILGIKGNEWAWRSRRYDSTDKFKIKEKKWIVSGIIGIILELLSFIIIFNIGSVILGYNINSKQGRSQYLQFFTGIIRAAIIPNKQTNSVVNKTTVTTYTAITNTLLCSDTDGGKNYLVTGEVTSNGVTKKDVCMGTICYAQHPVTGQGGCFPALMEYYCENNITKSANHNCEINEDCEFGACIPKSSETPHTLDLKINGSDGPITVPYGSIITATWNSTGDAYCRPSGSAAILLRGGAWNNVTNFKPSFPLSGTEKIYARTDDPNQKVLDIYIEFGGVLEGGPRIVDHVIVNLTTKP
ncbi:MAG: DUF2628 domain-containing protein [Minisyncoccia bacterium]